jgi:hypothetical protein
MHPVAWRQAICSARAAAAGNLGGSWKAWLSDETTNAADRIAEAGPWYEVLPSDSTEIPAVLFNNKSHLLTVPSRRIQRDEQGRDVTSGPDYVWTGTSVGGRRAAESCRGWKAETAEVGMAGKLEELSGAWTESLSMGCGYGGRLYCIQQ